MEACEMKFKNVLPFITHGMLALLLLLSSSGCAWLGFEEAPKPGDITVKLDGGSELRLVLLDSISLLVGKYEVANHQYRKFKPDHKSGEYKGLTLDKDDQPAVNVSWNDAVKFCKWLTEEHGTINGKSYVFRLPTEEEWIAFASCGDQREYPWGGEWPPPDEFNYFGLENPEVGPKLDRGDKFRVSAPVRKSGRNQWGIYGTAGNVWEWTSDKEGEKNRVMKGAAWNDSHPMFLKIDRRSSYEPGYRYVNLGFRVVTEPSGVVTDEKKKPE